MADSTTHVDTVAASQAAKDVTVDELVDALSPALTFGRHASECAGLTWAYYGGRLNISGSPTAIVNGTITLTPSVTCYVRVNASTGVVDFVTSAPVGWPAPSGYFALYEIDVGTDAPTDWTDLRPWNPGGTGTGGGGITALTGDVTASGSGSVAATIANDAVTNAKAANMANGTVKYRRTAGTGDPEDTTLTNLKTDLGLTGTNSGDQTISLTGDVTGSGTGSFAATIAANAVTNSKAAQMANATYKGRHSAGTGDPEDVSVANLKTDLGLAAIATSGSASDLASGTVPAARLPNPSSSTLGGVESIAAVSHQWINSISTSGVPALSQPAFSDISGTAAAAQLPVFIASGATHAIGAVPDPGVTAGTTKFLCEDATFKTVPGSGVTGAAFAIVAALIFGG